MTVSTEILVIGGGIAGLSAASLFALRAKTVVLERESALGYHSSGRSATFSHFGIGNAAVRGLTAASLAFFENPPAGFAESPLSEAREAMFIATPTTLGDLNRLEADMTRFTSTIHRIGPPEMLDRVPVLRTGGANFTAGLIDTGGRKLDSDILLQSSAKAVVNAGGSVFIDSPVTSIKRESGRWVVETPREVFSTDRLVNAGGAWADEIARMAGIKPLGLEPLRRTIIAFDPPTGLDVGDWPFTKTVSEDGFYMLPDSGRLLASPMDVTPSPAVDAQPEEYDVALAAWRVEEATTISIAKISHKWAGLRSFVADRVPTAGFASDSSGFFWLAGQGGFGLQTAPAMALAANALMFDLEWPKGLETHGVFASHVTPDRLFI